MQINRDQRGAVRRWGACALVIVVATGAAGQQVAKLTADDGAHADYFGSSVSLHSDTAIVGARADDDLGEDSGSAYLFENLGGVWMQIAKVTASDGSAGDGFGGKVALRADTALVSAYGDDDLGENSGAVYVFEKVGGAWEQIAKLIGAAGDGFGSPALSGGTAVIGAYGHNGVGSAYVFEKVAGVWTQVAELAPSDGIAGDRFGWGVSMTGDTLIIGADSHNAGKGAAYIFRRVGGVWTEIAKLTPDDAADWYGFGQSVSTDGEDVAVAALVNEAGARIGAAYVFQESGGDWQQVAKLVADDAEHLDYGQAVHLAIGGGVVVLGATGDDDGGNNAGGAYVFREQGGAWQQVAKFTATDATDYDYFGGSISIDGETVLIGALNAGWGPSWNGAAYLFQLQQPCAADFNGDGAANTLDVLAFLNAWAAGDSSSDFNGDGTVNTLDVLAFLNAWTAGC